MSGALAVFAKPPRPGEVKTRLVPPLTHEEAAELYACLLDDALEASAAACARLELVAYLAVHPPEAAQALLRRAPPGFRALGQRGAGLGARMQAAAQELAAAGHAPVLLRGSDSPALGPALLERALAALRAVDLVLSPDPDGGYNLVGLRRPAPGLFDHPMSTSRVLEDTLANARALGLRWELLEPGFDVDRVADLARVRALRGRPEAALCPRTLAFCEARGLGAPGASARRKGSG